MSNTSRSQSSSPDILGPPGDADYLISSPIKPFAGRQSWLSPATALRQTPAKRRRPSLSPAKSAHSIQFDDVLLPGSPTMKLTDRQRSLSPEKVQADGNVSPWRIRVTLEATQDEENQASPSRKRLRPSTVTTKIPLKDERSPLKERTPGRHRGRPRKADMQIVNGSPWPASPGHTPGPSTATPRKRGRPRKLTPKPKASEIVVAEDEPTPAAQGEQNPSPMDMTTEHVAEPEHQWNLADNGGSESDSLGADDLPIAHLRAPRPAQGQLWNDNANHEYGRTSFDTPTIGAMEHHFQDNDENIHSTPSKMPSPTRERLASSARSSRLTGSTSSPQIYPTPTPTSSLAEGENRNGEIDVNRDQTHDNQDARSGLADDHEEFDSIMESEGFTMISLDTLPSAKQHGLGLNARNATDNSSKLLRDRENGRIGDRLKRQLPGSIDDLRSDSQSSAKPSSAGVVPSPKPSSFPRRFSNLQQSIRKSPASVSYPELPVVESPNNKRGIFSHAKYEQAETTNQAGVVNAAMEEFDEYATQTGGDELDEADLGETEDEDTGEDGEEEPAISQSSPEQRRSLSQYHPTPARLTQREVEWQMARDAVSRQAQDPKNLERVVEIESDDNASQNEDIISNGDGADDGLLERSLAADEHLVEELQVRKPNPIDSSTGPLEGHSEEENIDDEGSIDIWRQEHQPLRRETNYEHASLDVPDQVGETEDGLYEEADGLDDIWQQEARDYSYLSQYSDSRFRPHVEETASPWTRDTSRSANSSHVSSSPAYVTREHGDMPYSDMTHIRKLRDQSVDLSAIMTREETPNRAHYYNGTSTPRSILSRRSATQHSSTDGSVVKAVSIHQSERRARLQPISQSSSPAAESGARHSSRGEVQRSPQRDPLPDRFARIDKPSESDLLKVEPVLGNPTTTPKSLPQSDGGAPASAWYQRITSLTPRWLKAPAHDQDDSSEPPSEEELEELDQSEPEPEQSESGVATADSPKRPQGKIEPAPVMRSSSSHASSSPSRGGEDPAQDPPSSPIDRDHSVHEENENSSEPRTSGDDVEDDAVNLIDDEHNKRNKLTKVRPLAVFGYFSDAHYEALRRIYRMAKRHPERFPYSEAPGRADIIGDWMWTSDGRHGVPITDVQFAIIDRFVYELSRADVQYGGSGQVEWTEADLHRRLISIIIGEQIRDEQQAKAARGASVDPWR